METEFFDCTRFIDTVDDEVKAILKARRIELGIFCGEGGFGKVYLGYDTNLHRNVAVKIIEERGIASRPPEPGKDRSGAAMAPKDEEEFIDDFFAEV